MTVHIVIAQKGNSLEPAKFEPITKSIECPKGSDPELIAEEAIDNLAEEHGISNFLWGENHRGTMENLVEGFAAYFVFYEKRRCAQIS